MKESVKSRLRSALDQGLDGVSENTEEAPPSLPSSSVPAAAKRPPEPQPGELAVKRADIKDEVEVLTRSRSRYRWVGRAFAAFAGFFVPLGLTFNGSTFLVMASVGLLGVGLATVLVLRKLARLRELTTERLSIELVSAQSLESDREESGG